MFPSSLFSFLSLRCGHQDTALSVNRVETYLFLFSPTSSLSLFLYSFLFVFLLLFLFKQLLFKLMFFEWMFLFFFFFLPLGHFLWLFWRTNIFLLDRDNMSLSSLGFAREKKIPRMLSSLLSTTSKFFVFVRSRTRLCDEICQLNVRLCLLKPTWLDDLLERMFELRKVD